MDTRLDTGPKEYPLRISLVELQNGHAVLTTDAIERHYDTVNTAAHVANAYFLRNEWWRADYGFTGHC